MGVTLHVMKVSREATLVLQCNQSISDFAQVGRWDKTENRNLSKNNISSCTPLLCRKTPSPRAAEDGSRIDQP